MSLKIAWKQNILVTDFHLLKSLLVVFGFGSKTTHVKRSISLLIHPSLLVRKYVLKTQNSSHDHCKRFGNFCHTGFQEVKPKSFCSTRFRRGPSINNVDNFFRIFDTPFPQWFRMSRNLRKLILRSDSWKQVNSA